jgi:signal transduction histidine kinase
VIIRQFIGREFILRCDKSRVERVLVNLIANSLEVMRGGGEILIRDWSDEGTVWIEMSDTGPGVSAEIRPRLFQPFVIAGKKERPRIRAGSGPADHAGTLWRSGIDGIE